MEKILWKVLPAGEILTTEHWEFALGDVCTTADARFFVRDAHVVRNICLMVVKKVVREQKIIISEMDESSPDDDYRCKYPLDLHSLQLTEDKKTWPIRLKSDFGWQSLPHQHLSCIERDYLDYFEFSIDPYPLLCSHHAFVRNGDHSQKYNYTDEDKQRAQKYSDFISAVLTRLSAEINADYTVFVEDSIEVMKYDHYTKTFFLATDNG